MSRSSSSSLGSSVMRLNSLRTLGSRLWRLADGAVDDLRAAPLMLVDAGAVLLHGEQVILERGVHALRRLRLGDRPAERANPPSLLEEPQAPLELLDALARVRHRRVIDHERGEHVTRRLARQLGEECGGLDLRESFERVDDLAQGRLRDVGRVEQRQEGRARPAIHEQQRDEPRDELLVVRHRRVRGRADGRGRLAQRGGQPLRLDPELRGIDAQARGRLAGQRRGLLGVAHLRQHQRDARERVGPGAGPGAVGLADRPLERVGQEAAGSGDARGEGGGALGAQEGVRIVTGGQQRDLHAQRAAVEGAGAVDRPREAPGRRLEQLLRALRRPLAGGVGVEKSHDLVAVAAQERQLRGRERRAERGHRLGEAVLVRHEAVDVALDEQRAVLRSHRLARDVGRVEEVALGVERRLGGVQVLRLVVAEGAAAEGHHARLEVADREQQAVAEAVVRAAAVLALHGEPRRHQRLLADLLAPHEVEQPVPAHAAAEAVEDALLGIDHERGRLLAVERAEALPVRARLAEVHEPSDEVHDVHTRPDVVEDGRRVGGHRQLTFSAATVAPAPPSDGSPSRNESTSGWLESSVRTALRSAPVPLPWTRRTWGRPAMNASSRYCSTRSRASSVVLPRSISSGPMPRPPAPPSLARDTRTGAAVTLATGASLRLSAVTGTRTVTVPARTVAVSPWISSSSPFRPRWAATTAAPGVSGPSLGAGSGTAGTTRAAASYRRRRLSCNAGLPRSARLSRSHSEETARRMSVRSAAASILARSSTARACSPARRSASRAAASRVAVSVSRRSSSRARSASERLRASSWASSSPSRRASAVRWPSALRISSGDSPSRAAIASAHDWPGRS